VNYLAHLGLLSYRETAGIGRALRGIEGRLKRPSRLGEAVAELGANYASLAADFAAFFPALIACAVQAKALLAGPCPQ
jgi:acyl carrier protein phosphodiesterase